MRTLKLPKGVLKELDHLSKQLFRSDDKTKRKLHSITLDSICKKKDVGGLGVKNLFLVDEAFFTKNLHGGS